MTEQQQKLYDKLLKKINEYCLGYAAEDVIAAIDALVDTYETPVDPAVNKNLTPLQALEKVKMAEVYIGSGCTTTFRNTKQYSIIETALKENEKLKKLYKAELKNTAYYNNLALKYKKVVEIITKPNR